MSWFSSLWNDLFGGGKKVNPPPVAPPVAAPAAPASIAEPSTIATTESALSTDNLPFINRKKSTMASGGSYGIGSNSTFGS